MRGLLILAAFLTILIFFLPFILGLVLFVICAAALFVLLARFGLLPGVTYRSYTFDARGRGRSRSETHREPPSPSPGGWYQEEQDGEIVTLPEGALKKDDEKF